MRYFFKYFFLLLITISSLAQSRDFKLVHQKGKVGLADENGQILIPAKYDAIGWSEGDQKPVGDYVGFKEDGLWGIISISNDIIAEHQYTRLYCAKGDLFIASKKGKFSHQDFLGVVGASGKTVIPFKYNSIDVNGLRAIVGVKTGRAYAYGIVDLGGKEILNTHYKEIQELGNLRFAVKNFENKYAIFNDAGKQIIDFSLDSISKFTSGYAVIYNNHLRGMIDSNGKVIAEPVYKGVKVGYGIETLRFNQWEKLNGNSVVDELRCDKVEPIDEDLYRVTSNGRCWLINKDHEVITSPSYSFVDSLKFGSRRFCVNNKWGAITPDSSIVLEPVFDSLLQVNGNYYALKNNIWWLYDSYGVKKSLQNYEAIGGHYGNYFAVKKNGKWGYIDREGNEVIHCVYQEVSEILYNKIIVKFHGQYAIINKYGDWIVLPQPGRLKILNNNLYLVDKSGLKTLKGFDDETIYFTENEIEIKEDHLLEHLSSGGLWKIDFSGRIVNRELPQQKFEEIRESSEGLFAVKVNGAYGFVDNQNRLIVANRYQDVGDFSDEVVSVKLIGKWGYIDRHEKILIQPVYQEAGPFNNGLAIVKDKTGYGIINKQGKRVSIFGFEEIALMQNGHFLVKKDGKLGMLDAKGSLMINAKYDELKELENGFLRASLFGKYGILTNTGVDVVPIMYDQIIYDHRFDNYLAMKKSKWENLSN